MQLTPKPGKWTDVLPAPWCDDPFVLVIMAPDGAKSSVIEMKGGYLLGVLEHNGTRRGLQVLHPEMATYVAHSDVFDRYHINMPDPAYVGRLSAIPDHLLVNDFHPLIFQRDVMWRPYLPLRSWARGATKKGDNHVN